LRLGERFDLDFGLVFGAALTFEAVLALAVDLVFGLEVAM
jgi:hypothetical protein